MIYSELAYRYASALFDLGKEGKKTDQYLAELQALEKILESDKSVELFVTTPLVRSSDKEKALEAALKTSGVSSEVANFCFLLARKGRLPLLSEIILGYQSCADRINNVVRGVVRSPIELNANQKTELVNKISAITKKKVELQFTLDKTLIGGLRAQVGSWTFDDSLSEHLKRMKEDLTRRIN